ncbi:hypothetical protein BC831DRAFT_448654 [Entophlyctis helioformis]|nr:hypothetical protein BC831DRAFT_448654 [Entophlyctis helioformis]
MQRGAVQLLRQECVWSAPLSLHLDVDDAAPIAVVFRRAATADPTVRVTCTINGAPDAANSPNSPSEPVAAISESLHNSAATLRLRVHRPPSPPQPAPPSSLVGSLFSLGKSVLWSSPNVQTQVTVSVEIADACQAGLNIAVSGSKATSIDFHDEFAHAFGDVAIAFSSDGKPAGSSKWHMEVSPDRQLAGLSYRPTAELVAKSLKMRSFRFDGSSQESMQGMSVGDMDATGDICITGKCSLVRCGKLTAGGEGGLVIDLPSGDIMLDGVEGTHASITTLSGSASVFGAMNMAGNLALTAIPGSIRVNGHIHANELAARTSTGQLLLTTTVCETASVQATSGHIKTGAMEVHGYALVCTTSGHITGGDIVSGDRFMMGSASGNISMGDMTARVEASIITNSGHASVGTVWTRSFVCTATTSNCKVDKIHAVDHVHLERASGNVNAQVEFVGDGDGMGERAATLRTTTGRLECAVAQHKMLTAQTGSGAAVLALTPYEYGESVSKVSTTRGDAQLAVGSGFRGTVKIHSNSRECRASQGGELIGEGSSIERVIGGPDTSKYGLMDVSSSHGKIAVDFAA